MRRHNYGRFYVLSADVESPSGKFGTHISACAVTLSARAAQKFRHCRARPTAALAGGEALAIEMIGDGLG